MVTDQDISQTIQSLFQESNPNTFTTLNGVVQELESKLGLDLTHKVDFINAQIHILFGSHPPQPQPQPPPQPQPQPQPQPLTHLHYPPKDQFALRQVHNYHPGPSPVPSAFQSFSSQPEPVKPETAAPDDIDAEVAAAVAGTEAPKESVPNKPKRRGGPGGLNKVCGVSPELQVIVGQPALPRTEIVKQLWAYIRKNNLQDPSNKRKIICNDELRLVFETDCTDMFKMNKLLAKHIIALEPTKQPASKKRKVDVESALKSTETGPSVLLSEALSNFFGIGGTEMLQSEVLRRIWEYIKVHHLEDPSNPMAILCDAKLQELFGCESISALGIPEVLAGHHIFRK